MALRTVFLLIGTGGITSTYIGSGAVTHSALAADAVEAGNIKDGEVGNAELGAGAVDASKADLSDTWNFNSGSLQVDGQGISSGGIYYMVVDVVEASNIDPDGGAPTVVDGFTLISTGKLVLAVNQSPDTEDGVWEVTTLGTGNNGTWDRPADRNDDSEVPPGVLVYVKGGNTYGGTLWKHTGNHLYEGWVQLLEGMSPIGSNGEPYDVDGASFNGSNLTFDLTGVTDLIYAAVLVNGIAQESTAYHLSQGTGTDNCDQLVFESGNAPTSGMKVQLIGFTRS